MKICFGDLEANGFLDVATKVHCGVFIDNDTHEVFKFMPSQIQEMLAFMDTVDVMVMHNGIGYDWPLLEKLYGYSYKGKRVDTLVMSRLLNPKRIKPYNCPTDAGPHSLEAWGYRVGRGKPEHNDWENFSEEMLHRCTEDVEILVLVYNALLAEAKGGKWRNAFLMSFELFGWLQKQEAHGWLVDRPHMEFCISQLTGWVRRIDSVIVPKLPMILEVEETKEKGEYKYVKKPFLKSGEYAEATRNWILNSGLAIDSRPVVGPYSRITFRVTNLDSGAETKDYLLQQGWEPLEWNTNDAGERTSPKLSKDDPFDGIENKVGKLVAKRVQCRHRRSSIEGLIKLIRPDGRIASAVNTLAATGRATHRNIVNIPRGGSFFGKQMRQTFICPKDKSIVGTDSDGCQLRMLAGRMKGKAYIEAIVNGDKKKGTDNHSMTRKIADLEDRDVAKSVMYCLLFGGGDPKLAKTAKKPAGSGAAIRAKLYKGLDGLEELMAFLTAEWKATARQRYNPKYNKMEYFDGKITGLDGRPITVPSEHMLLVYLLQSDESIMMAKAYCLANERLSAKYVYGKQFGFLCWMHDEYQIECDKDIAEDVKTISEQAIVDAGEFFNIACPHKGEGTIGNNWYETH
jgi:DNA polymerase-1